MWFGINTLKSPKGLLIDQVEKESHLACIKAEDEFNRG
jgi:hypothetical protein